MINQMWRHGPLRHVSTTSHNGWLAGLNGMFYGPYVCSGCRRSTVAVYAPKWHCAACRGKE